LPIIVKKNKNESKDDIIGKFRRLTLEEEIVDEVKERVAYVKPSAARYAKKKVNIWRKKCRKKAKNARRKF
jgi:ribosomal protein S21